MIKLYVFYNNFSEIARIDPTRFSLQATYELAIRPTSAALSADEHLFYFEHELQQRIHTYHLKTKEINEQTMKI